MQTGKTSSTELKTLGIAPALKSVHDVTTFDPLDELVFSVQDPNAVTREHVAEAARKVFGAGPESAELVSKLVEHMLSVSDSRSKVVAELVILGGHLTQMLKLAIGHHTGKVGTSLKSMRMGATLCFDFIKAAMGITRPSAYNYIRCHQRFADNAEAIKIFSFGELNLLAAKHVTDEQITAIMEQKRVDKDMTRADVKAMLKELQAKEEEIVDRDNQLVNLEGLLADNKLELDMSVRENRHLIDQIAGHERNITERDKSIANLQELLAQRSAGYPALEQELASKKRAFDEVTAELTALRNSKPKVERIEVPVETLPASFANLQQACQSAMDDLNGLEERKIRLQSEIEEIQASVASQLAERDAGAAVKDALDELMRAWSDVSGKMATVQLAVQASRNPEQYNPTLEALAATMRKYVAEIDAALSRSKH
jgi:hypothetical protein